MVYVASSNMPQLQSQSKLDEFENLVALIDSTKRQKKKRKIQPFVKIQKEIDVSKFVRNATQRTFRDHLYPNYKNKRKLKTEIGH